MNISVLLGEGRMSGEAGCAKLLAEHFPMKILNNKTLEGEGDVLQTGNFYYPTGNNYRDALDSLDTDIVFISTVGPFAQQLPQIVKRYPTILQLGQNLLEFALTPSARNAIPHLFNIMLNVDAVVAPSEYAKDCVEAIGLKNVVHIPGPMDTQKFPEANGESKKLVMLGRMEVIKNYITPLLAMRKVIREDINAEIDWMSTGNLMGFYKNVIGTLGLSDRVNFLGYEEEKNKVLENARVFIQPSLSEMASRTLKEALSCGLPCVASDIGGHHFSDSISFVKHDSPKEFADEILNLLKDDELWRERHKQALEDKERFDIQNVKDDYQELFERVMKLDKFEG